MRPNGFMQRHPNVCGNLEAEDRRLQAGSRVAEGPMTAQRLTLTCGQVQTTLVQEWPQKVELAVTSLLRIIPMQLSLIARPFDNPDWLFEWKADGFRASAYVSDGSCKLVSRKDNAYKTFGNLSDALAKLKAKAILDGEIVCLDEAGSESVHAVADQEDPGVVLCVRSVVARR